MARGMLQLLRKQALLELLLFLEKGVKEEVVSCQLRIKRLLEASFHDLISSLKALGYARDREVSRDSTLKPRTQKLRPLSSEGTCIQRF